MMTERELWDRYQEHRWQEILFRSRHPGAGRLARIAARRTERAKQEWRAACRTRDLRKPLPPPTVDRLVLHLGDGF